jgi:methionyl-tRNA synthetase
MKPGKRKIIVTTALPYANGDVHLGHILEGCLVDFWTRFQKMRGNDCHFICADDTHGTPIMVNAMKKGMTPEEMIKQSFESHIRDFKGFEIAHDFYSTTHSEDNRKISEEIFKALKEKGHIEERTIKQTYCEKDKMFLPDRYVKGTCPKCGTPDQYGDLCENCSSTYDPLDLKQPHCILCGSKPVERDSNHLFIKLEDFRSFLKEWVPAHNQKEVANKLAEWLDGELHPWCISRDAPYFGFEIPGYKDKFFYVWLDAPVGYISSTKQWAEKAGRKFEDFWRSSDTEIYHCIGKDIIYFHSLFWPAMLKTAGFTTPTGIWVHGMLTSGNLRLSKSRGTAIEVKTYLKHLNPAYFRYYMACKLGPDSNDMDFNPEDFVSRVNSDLIGKITNVASRGATMLQKLGGVLSTPDAEGLELIKNAQARHEEITTLFETRNFAKAMIAIRDIADEANRYFDKHEPWKLIKTDPERTKQILTTILNLFRIMAVYLKPILPTYVSKVEQLFDEKPYDWQAAQTTLTNKAVATYQHLLNRADPALLVKVMEESAQDKAPQKETTKTAKANEIEFDEFAKVDLRVGKVIKAESVEGADKLLRLTVDMGDHQRTILSGIKASYKPEVMQDKLVVVVANLKARKMKFGISEGMILAAGEGKDIVLIEAGSGAKPGDKVS